MASKWSLFYPRPILNMVSKKGIGGFIDPTLEGSSDVWFIRVSVFTKTISGMDVTFNSGLILVFRLGI